MSGERALSVVAQLIAIAQIEVDRLARRVKINAEAEPGRSSSAGRIPMPVGSTAVEERIALRVAKGQVEALRAVEIALMRGAR